MALFSLQAGHLVECALLIQLLKLCPGPVGNFPGKFFDVVAARSGINDPVEVAFHFKQVLQVAGYPAAKGRIRLFLRPVGRQNVQPVHAPDNGRHGLCAGADRVGIRVLILRFLSEVGYYKRLFAFDAVTF